MEKELEEFLNNADRITGIEFENITLPEEMQKQIDDDKKFIIDVIHTLKEHPMRLPNIIACGIIAFYADTNASNIELKFGDYKIIINIEDADEMRGDTGV